MLHCPYHLALSYWNCHTDVESYCAIEPKPNMLFFVTAVSTKMINEKRDNNYIKRTPDEVQINDKGSRPPLNANSFYLGNSPLAF